MQWFVTSYTYKKMKPDKGVAPQFNAPLTYTLNLSLFKAARARESSFN